MLALIVAGLWAGVALTRGAARPMVRPGRAGGHFSRAVELIRG